MGFFLEWPNQQKKKKKYTLWSLFMDGCGSTVSRLEPLRGGGLHQKKKKKEKIEERLQTLYGITEHYS